MLAKARHFLTDTKDLISLYYTIFSSILTYGAQVWGLLSNSKLNKVETAQKAAIRIISFSDFHAHTSPIFKSLKILRLQEHIKLQHILLVYDIINKNLPSSFNDFFVGNDMNWVKTRAESQASTNIVFSQKYNQIKYGRKSITNTSVNIWNRFAKHIFPNTNMYTISRNKLKEIVTKHFLESYKDIDD